MTTPRAYKTVCDPEWCPIEQTLSVIGGMWKILIIRELLRDTQRYGQLHRALVGVTHKMLTQQLRELEVDGVVHREVFREVPPKVEYSLTPLGLQLVPLLNAMREWGVALETVRQPAVPATSQEQLI
jgi:DNA-binding HxlR family transcriptional regulator